MKKGTRKYAHGKTVKLSNLAEDQLGKSVSDIESQKISPLVKSISGVVSEIGDRKTKKDYSDFLKRKYR